MAKKLLTLCIVHQNDRVLLGMKKRGFGEGLYNGFGGKVNDHEDVSDAAMRELQEEAHITPKDMTKCGILTFTFEGLEEKLEVHVFKCTDFNGQVGESEEMNPQWFEIANIPFEKMWKDDPYWFPLFLKNKRFIGAFSFDTENDLTSYDVREVALLQ